MSRLSSWAFGLAVAVAPITSWADVTLDFSTEDDFVTPLFNGQSISSPDQFGRLVSIGALGEEQLRAAILDSNPRWLSRASRKPGLLVGLGNVLVLQREGSLANTSGSFGDSNDGPVGGTLAFDFVNPSELLSVDLIDLDRRGATTVTLFDGDGLRRAYRVPGLWANDPEGDGYGTLDLTTLAAQVGEWGLTATGWEDAGFDSRGVNRLLVTFSGMAALDNLRFEVVPAPGAALLGALGFGLLMAGKRRRRVPS